MDEVLGGILGVLQGALIVGCLFVILDSVFLIPNIGHQGELPFLRGFFEFYNESATANLFRTQLIPGFYNVFGLLVPDSLQSFYFAPTSPAS